MMSMHFPYGNTNTAGQHLYRTSVYPNFGFNYNQYFASFGPNSNGLLPIPTRTLLPSLMEQNTNFTIREYKPRLAKSHSSSITFPIGHKEKTDVDSNDFLTFIEQKAKPISELNPFANEFSLVKNNNNNQIVTPTNETSSSYKLIFDDLIEQSLQSIEAIKKASKSVSVNHVSTQYNQSIDQMNRSTQTNNDNDQHNLLEEYSKHTVELTNKLLDNFNYLLLLANENGLHNQLKLTSHLCDELRYLILAMNELITSNKSSMNKDNLFSNMVKDLSIQSSPIMFGIGRRTHRLISSSSISYSSTPSFSSRQIDPITIVTSKICLLCQKPVDDSDDFMHKLCRLLSSPPDR